MHVVQDPMQKALQENHLLMLTYNLRLKQVNNEAQRSAMYLGTMRKCLENISAARKEQAVLKAKLKEREERLRQEAAAAAAATQRALESSSTLSSSSSNSIIFNTLSAILNSSSGSSASVIATALSNGLISQAEASLINRAIEFDAATKDTSNTQLLLQEIVRTPNDKNAIHKFILNLFDYQKHPFCVYVAETQFTLLTAYDKTSSTSSVEEARDSLRSICSQVQNLKSRLSELIPFTYRQLNNPAVDKDQIPFSLEDVIFPQINSVLCKLFTTAYSDDIQLYKSGFECAKTHNLKEVGVKEKFWLGVDVSVFFYKKKRVIKEQKKKKKKD